MSLLSSPLSGDPLSPTSHSLSPGAHKRPSLFHASSLDVRPPHTLRLSSTEKLNQGVPVAWRRVRTADPAALAGAAATAASATAAAASGSATPHSVGSGSRPPLAAGDSGNVSLSLAPHSHSACEGEEFGELEIIHAAKAAAELAHALMVARSTDWEVNRTAELSANMLCDWRARANILVWKDGAAEGQVSPVPSLPLSPPSALHHLPHSERRQAVLELQQLVRARKRERDEAERARFEERLREKQRRKLAKEEAKRRAEMEADEEYKRREREKRKQRKGKALTREASVSTNSRIGPVSSLAVPLSPALAAGSGSPVAPVELPAAAMAQEDYSALVLNQQPAPASPTPASVTADVLATLPSDAPLCSACPQHACTLLTLDSYHLSLPLHPSSLTSLDLSLLARNHSAQTLCVHLSSNAPQHIFIRPSNVFFVHAHATVQIGVDYVGDFSEQCKQMQQALMGGTEEQQQQQQSQIDGQASDALSSLLAPSSSPTSPSSSSLSCPHTLTLSVRPLSREDIASGFASMAPHLFWAYADKQDASVRTTHAYPLQLQWKVGDEQQAGIAGMDASKYKALLAELHPTPPSPVPSVPSSDVPVPLSPSATDPASSGDSDRPASRSNTSKRKTMSLREMRAKAAEAGLQPTQEGQEGEEEGEKDEQAEDKSDLPPVPSLPAESDPAVAKVERLARRATLRRLSSRRQEEAEVDPLASPPVSQTLLEQAEQMQRQIHEEAQRVEEEQPLPRQPLPPSPAPSPQPEPSPPASLSSSLPSIDFAVQTDLTWLEEDAPLPVPSSSVEFPAHLYTPKLSPAAQTGGEKEEQAALVEGAYDLTSDAVAAPAQPGEDQLAALLTEWESALQQAEGRRAQEVEQLASLQSSPPPPAPVSPFSPPPPAPSSSAQRRTLRAQLSALEQERDALMSLEQQIKQLAQELFGSGEMNLTEAAAQSQSITEESPESSPSSSPPPGSAFSLPPSLQQQYHSLRQQMLSMESVRGQNRSRLLQELEKLKPVKPSPNNKRPQSQAAPRARSPPHAVSPNRAVSRPAAQSSPPPLAPADRLLIAAYGVSGDSLFVPLKVPKRRNSPQPPNSRQAAAEEKHVQRPSTGQLSPLRHSSTQSVLPPWRSMGWEGRSSGFPAVPAPLPPTTPVRSRSQPALALQSSANPYQKAMGGKGAEAAQSASPALKDAGQPAATRKRSTPKQSQKHSSAGATAACPPLPPIQDEKAAE